MRTAKTKIPYNVVLVFENGLTRTVMVQAVSRETAERKALKRNPNAIDVKRNS
jgi:hypothetical protein